MIKFHRAWLLLVCGVIFMPACRMMEDDYDAGTPKKYTINQNIEGKYRFSLHHKAKITDNKVKKYFNIVEILNIKSSTTTQLTIFFRVFTHDSLHLKKNLQYEKLIEINTPLMSNVSWSDTIDTFYSDKIYESDIEVIILSENNLLVAGRGKYQGIYEGYSESELVAIGIADGYVDYKGKVAIELEDPVDQISLLKGVTNNTSLFANFYHSTGVSISSANGAVSFASDSLVFPVAITSSLEIDSLVFKLSK